MKRFKTVIPIYDWATLTFKIVDIIIGHDGGLERGSYSRVEGNCLIELEPHRITHGCITHEAKHCAGDVLACCGVKTTSANDEAEAYLVDWIVRWMEWCVVKSGVRIPSPKAFGGHRKMPRTKRGPKFELR